VQLPQATHLSAFIFTKTSQATRFEWRHILDRQADRNSAGLTEALN
jgi:hypothetical protein